MKNPIVSVCMICYNQEVFIKQAIEGVLMQKTNFIFELVIGEDCSNDGTFLICQNYAHENPDQIRLLPSVSNLGSMKNFIRTMSACGGRYIAICEGDDYWTDPYKLQKQVDFLQSNNDFVFSFHDVMVLQESTGENFPRIGGRVVDEIVDLKSVIVQNNIATASIVFRNVVDFMNLPAWFYQNAQKGDYGLVVILAERGKGKYHPEKMGVYRVHGGGIWSGQNIDKRYQADEFFYRVLGEYFKTNELKAIVKQKECLVQFNWGINLIRRRRYFRGIKKVLQNYSSCIQGRWSENPRRILSAFREGLLLSSAGLK